MAAAAPEPLFSTLYADATCWDDPNPDYVRLQGVFGAEVNVAGAAAMAAINGLASRSPVVLAFVLNEDPDYIMVGHSISMYPVDPLNTTAYDGHMIVMVGDRKDEAMPFAFEDTCFGRLGGRTPVSNIDVAHARINATPPHLRSEGQVETDVK